MLMGVQEEATLSSMSGTEKKEIVFVPYKLHLRFFLFELAKKLPIAAMVPPEKTLSHESGIRGIPIHYLQFGAQFLKSLVGSVRTLKYIPHLASLLDQHPMRAIVSFEYYHWYTFQCLAYKKRHPEVPFFIVWETKRWPRNIIARMFKYLALIYVRAHKKYIDGIFVYTEAAQEFAEKRMAGVPIAFLPAPTDTTLFTPDPHKAFCIGGVLRIIINARYASYKRHKDAFAALRILRARGKNVRLTCISRGQEGKESMVRCAREMGVADSVDFIDPRSSSELPALYREHDLLLLPSYNEAIGMVVPEAMACGIPTITTDTVGANVYVDPGETGFIYTTGNVDELVNVLERCCDAHMLSRMGEAAHRRIAERFTPEVVVKNFIADIEKTVIQ